MSRHNQMSVAHSHRLAFDGTVLECVLLAIIEAHTTPATDGDQHRRLNAAMDALTGDPKASKQDEANAKAFEWMARERQRDACNHEMSVLLAGPNEAKRPRRSVRELAILAAHEFLNCLNDDELLAATDMLCGKIWITVRSEFGL